MIHQGEVTKGAGGAWPKDVTLFLFDHQLVYCKRDLLKRNTFVYRGRLNLDMCEVVDQPSSKGEGAVVCRIIIALMDVWCLPKCICLTVVQRIWVSLSISDVAQLSLKVMDVPCSYLFHVLLFSNINTSTLEAKFLDIL